MPRRTFATRPIEVADDAHLLELRYDDGENDGIAVCAGHGGDVEPGTAETAVELATRLPAATCWATLAEAEDSAFDRFHPASTAIAPEDYPLLAEIADRGFETVVSLHGLSDDEVLVGGGIDDGTKERVATRLDEALSAPVAVAPPGEYGGTHPENFVNWLAADGGGLQLELGPTARSEEAPAVRSVLASFLEGD